MSYGLKKGFFWFLYTTLAWLFLAVVIVLFGLGTDNPEQQRNEAIVIFILGVMFSSIPAFLLGLVTGNREMAAKQPKPAPTPSAPQTPVALSPQPDVSEPAASAMAKDSSVPLPKTPSLKDTPEQLEQLRKLNHAIYALYAASFLFFFTALIGVMLAYTKQAQTQTPWVLGHFRWQIRTFWFGMSWMFISALLTPFYGLGVPLLALAVIWYIYRIVKGWMTLADKQSPYGLTHPTGRPR